MPIPRIPDLIRRFGKDTFFNKTIDLTNNTLIATSLQLATAVTDETGSGELVFATSPTLTSPSLVTPALGTPASGVLTNCSGVLTNFTGLPQGGLSTTTGDVTTAAAGLTNLTLPGGLYGFYPNVFEAGSNAHTATICDADTNSAVVGRIAMSTTGGTATARQRYVQASPPYDLGDGNIPIFIFALLDSSGNVIATYCAEDPPWANNGPTNIAPDKWIGGKPMKLIRPRLSLAELRAGETATAQLVEITQEFKQTDMPLIPHPFLGNNLTGKTVVLLDPVSDLVHRLHEFHLSGESVTEVLHGKYLKLDAGIARACSPGVMPVAVAWK